MSCSQFPSMSNRQQTYSILIQNKEGKVVLCQTESGWQLPKVEKKSTQKMKRVVAQEVKKRTGYQASEIHLIQIKGTNQDILWLYLVTQLKGRRIVGDRVKFYSLLSLPELEPDTCFLIQAYKRLLLPKISQVVQSFA